MSQYLFQSLRQNRYLHLDPETLNNFLKNIVCGGVLRAHGWRTTVLTTGIDVLHTDSDVIRKRMGHLPEGRVAQAYDRSERLDERREFLNQWCDLLERSVMKI
ncbi:hypothetical protein [Synechococcus sp. M16CYN]|uniref:hypothetical protein n=1 Tax=Synechococcus sp. M16CYN TaxID=3103139 RepID=UPI0033408172